MFVSLFSLSLVFGLIVLNYYLLELVGLVIVVICSIFLVKFTTSGADCWETRHILQISIMATKWDIEKFSGENNFGFLKMNMKAILFKISV